MDLEIFAAVPPSLEPLLLEEVHAAGWTGAEAGPGGVTFRGGWPDVWRANLVLRGAGRILVRVAEFPAVHLAQLDKRARKVDWTGLLRPDRPVRVEVATKASRIYHAGAAAERIERAIADATGAPIVAAAEDAVVALKVRIDRNLVTISLDSSGAPLHRRGHKEAVGKAPMRETLAALFLRRCGYDGTGPVLDPMCGSGTFVIEAAEIAAGLHPGRDRAFAFEELASFDPGEWAALRQGGGRPVSAGFHGSDRDDGAVRSAAANAARAGVADLCSFERRAVSDAAPPPGPPGLVMVNPPYGARIGNRKLLFGLYGALGRTLAERFRGWRVGIVTSDGGLARATGLPFLPADPPVPHGGLRVTLWRTDPLP
ncbi:THUMP domain-containing class I SAM-dependent RNA methyltransferase [Wenxinia saemankumensis]|uniref:Putative N6-adenine-specific DNA methylase n=1 Tax=Wenxinia saemankumensis TaxID=1447782 RepID=A0A1M6DV82_9RHOB|nr:RNA methyltransferase [Wenxinia saemankumensis]SHI77030.1 putative N6-adenine-specific DNA methylase [Wenxinia saemankumensis]